MASAATTRIHRPTTPGTGHRSPGADRARRKFLRIFPKGFRDPDYVSLERMYKWDAHLAWDEALSPARVREFALDGQYATIAARAITIESRTNLLFSFEKMALRDAVKSAAGARSFALGLDDFLHGPDTPQARFERWIEVVAALPRKQTRVLTWPVVTVFGFIAQPKIHLFVKPTVTRVAARKYGFDLPYQSRPSWETYDQGMLGFARRVGADLRDLRPRDMIDLQSFIWIQGSDEYA